MTKTITSVHNPLIKQFYSLRVKSRERKKSGLFGIEGIRETNLAIQGGYTIETLLYCPEIISEEDLEHFQKQTPKAEHIEITPEIYNKLAYRGSTQGVLAVAKAKDHSLATLELSKENPLILVAEAPEKPGNIGALLRTADAANANAVIIANPNTDLYNPNTIRSSLGCLFTNSVATGTTSEIISYLTEKSIGIYCAALQASVPYHTCDFQKASALVMGTESQGLSEEWLQNSTQNIIIPMQGVIDSMNVSVAGILIFEAKRQRDFD